VEKGRDVNELMNSIMSYVDKNGVVDSKSGNPMTSQLSMHISKVGFSAKFNAFQAAQGNGACDAEVEVKGDVVFKASGKYVAGAYDVKATIFKPGPWMERIPEWKRLDD
jgi:hypothetical protein